MDILVRHGGTAILSETPEIYGVEHMLVRRAVSEARWGASCSTASSGGRGIHRAATAARSTAWWARQPGRRLANIFEKSLGSAMKGGTTPLNAVYDYAEPITEKRLRVHGLARLRPVSATGQIASGANLICFTTGRGSMFGAKPVPSLKLASNTPMFRAARGRHGHQLRRGHRRHADGAADGQRSSSTSCAARRANPARANSWAWATTSSCPGTWAS
jgi:altronate hydrolase